MHARTHARTQLSTRGYMHARTTHTCTHACTCAHACTHACALARSHTHPHARSPTRLHAYHLACMQRFTQSRLHVRMHSCGGMTACLLASPPACPTAHLHARMHACTRTRTRACARMQAHMLACTHARTHGCCCRLRAGTAGQSGATDPLVVLNAHATMPDAHLALLHTSSAITDGRLQPWMHCGPPKATGQVCARAWT